MWKVKFFKSRRALIRGGAGLCSNRGPIGERPLHDVRLYMAVENKLPGGEEFNTDSSNFRTMEVDRVVSHKRKSQ